MKKNYYETVRGRKILHKIASEIAEQWLMDSYIVNEKFRFQRLGKLYIELENGEKTLHLFEKPIYKEINLLSEYTEEEFKKYGPEAAFQFMKIVLSQYLHSKGFPKIKTAKYISQKIDREMIKLTANIMNFPE